MKVGSRKAPHPKYFVGEGKAVVIAEAVKATGASVVLFAQALSPAQERNLERLCECRVIDRTGLILDIFAQRARTHEGKLQVELFAQALSPAQERNLERLCECRVIDRTGLILDIFAQRARTHEGKLQVELAQLGDYREP